MFKLMKLELKRINLRPYLISSSICTIILLGFTYFIACVAQIEHEIQFMNYANIFKFTIAISTLIFGILTATMYTKLVISEYSGKRLSLLFSYPVSRKKIFIAKVLIVVLFIIISMLISNFIWVSLFTISESFMPIITDTLTYHLLLEVFKMTLISITVVNSIAIIAMGIGFIKKSVSMTLISAFILFSIYGNMIVSSFNNVAIAFPIIITSLSFSLIILLILSYKINHMEVE